MAEDATDIQAQLEAVEFTSRLIQFDTQNAGDNRARETEAAQWVADRLAEVGIRSTLVDSAPGRTNLIADIPGENPDLPVLLIHGHLDTVPARLEDWSVDPLGGDIHPDADGVECVWGRGAIDMKDMVGMSLAALRAILRSGGKPHRSVRFILFADEEAGGFKGSEWIAQHHPEWFDHVGAIISETGGFGGYVDGRRVYYVQAGEKGTQWFRLNAQGTQSHGSQINRDNAVVKIAKAAARIADYSWPADAGQVGQLLVNRLQDIVRQEEGQQAKYDTAELIDRTGPAKPWVASSVRNTFNVTSIDADSTVNIVPAKASALIDGRALPGQEDTLLERLHELAGPEVNVEKIHRSRGYVTDVHGELFTAIERTLSQVDPDAVIVPFLSSGGTDSKAVLKINPDIEVCGFIPLRVPQGFDVIGNFHGVDEHVPVDALKFGQDVLRRFITTF